MTTHYMNLQPRYFNYIKSGTKRIELRLNDEKRRQLLNALNEFYPAEKQRHYGVLGIRIEL